VPVSTALHSDIANMAKQNLIYQFKIELADPFAKSELSTGDKAIQK